MLVTMLPASFSVAPASASLEPLLPELLVLEPPEVLPLEPLPEPLEPDPDDEACPRLLQRPMLQTRPALHAVPLQHGLATAPQVDCPSVPWLLFPQASAVTAARASSSRVAIDLSPSMVTVR
jgi:hypothetical protein